MCSTRCLFHVKVLLCSKNEANFSALKAVRYSPTEKLVMMVIQLSTSYLLSSVNTLQSCIYSDQFSNPTLKTKISLCIQQNPTRIRDFYLKRQSVLHSVFSFYKYLLNCSASFIRSSAFNRSSRCEAVSPANDSGAVKRGSSGSCR